jgi:hypothetical protein
MISARVLSQRIALSELHKNGLEGKVSTYLYLLGSFHC